MNDNKDTAIVKYDSQEITNSDNKVISAIKHIKEIITKSKGAYDLLKYRYKDNGVVLFIYGPEENSDKIIERLEQVIKKYKEKRGSLKSQSVKTESFIRKLLNG
jgi:hypothetical protein